MTAAIEAVQLRRQFRVRSGWWRPQHATVTAVEGLDLAVGQGELLGLLGPNGAGKTTTIKMLTTLLLPTSGTATVLGLDVVKQTAMVRSKIGVVFGGDRGLYDRLSARDNLRYFAELYGVPPKRQAQRIGELLEQVGLDERQADRVEGYSRGMKQRLHIARGLLHDPAVLFLDEPTIGLDPLAARELRRTVAALRDAGRTIVLTTHYMFEADELCDKIGIMDRGRLLTLDDPSSLKARFAGRLVVDVLVRDVGDRQLARVKDLPAVLECTSEPRGPNDNLTVQGASGTTPDEVHQALSGVLSAEQVVDFRPREATLEDAYVAVVGEHTVPTTPARFPTAAA